MKLNYLSTHFVFLTSISQLSVIPILILLVSFFLWSCNKNETDSVASDHLTEAYSIFMNQDHLLVSGYENSNNEFTTQYWLDGVETSADYFTENIDQGTVYQKSTGEFNSRTTFEYKNEEGELETYQFEPIGSLVEDGKIFYYKNSQKIAMDTTALGTISAFCMVDNKPCFAGIFGQMQGSEAGESLAPKTPFYWDGISTPEKLPIPNETYFKDISCMHISESNDVYIGGLIGQPMYWKNSEPVILNTLYGEVKQIITHGTDVYAVGFYNKSNSNSTGHTACYWKNSELVELDDNAQANGIYLDGEDVYVAGSTGRVPVEYQACYWKNGVYNAFSANTTTQD